MSWYGKVVMRDIIRICLISALHTARIPPESALTAAARSTGAAGRRLSGKLPHIGTARGSEIRCAARSCSHAKSSSWPRECGKRHGENAARSRAIYV